jgi:hypothetical protein
VAEGITRVTLFVPGAERAKKLPKQVEVERVDNDGTFAAAFSFGTVEPEVIAAIEAAAGALVLHWPIDLREGREEIVGTVKRLRDAGALAVRIEQSKLGWEVARWIELFSSDDPSDWHRGAVAFVRGDRALQSCGMHAFSLPDVRIGLDGDARELQPLAEALDLYQLAEDPEIQSGQTFAPDRETPKRVLERWPDTEYAADHACHNPYGVWRLGPPGGKARPTGELLPVFVPALRLLLAAAEEKRRLTKKQVEAIRDNGSCVMMTVRDAQSLERTRGYADLDPELVWEQWKLLRNA